MLEIQTEQEDLRINLAAQSLALSLEQDNQQVLKDIVNLLKSLPRVSVAVRCKLKSVDLIPAAELAGKDFDVFGQYREVGSTVLVYNLIISDNADPLTLLRGLLDHELLLQYDKKELEAKLKELQAPQKLAALGRELAAVKAELTILSQELPALDSLPQEINAQFLIGQAI
ncbi:MAG: hypothetical protein DRP78_06825 [Candidatus Omnitrophota bacterium]|nr:MAG: hypothetical protein DRP78_06825 [Candidatus Omnitrophota bacterium]